MTTDAVWPVILIAVLVVNSALLVVIIFYLIQAARARSLSKSTTVVGDRADVLGRVAEAAEKLGFKIVEMLPDGIVFKAAFLRVFPGPVMRVALGYDRGATTVSVSSLDDGYYGWRAADVISMRLISELRRTSRAQAAPRSEPA